MDETEHKTSGSNWICSRGRDDPKRPLTSYGRQAERHWREFLPTMTAELEAKGQLHALLLEAEEQTAKELDSLRRHLIQQGLTPMQAHDRAWEIVRERYIFLPPEK